MWFIYLPVLLFIILKVYLKFTCGISKSDALLAGKVVIVTGSNTGIGYEAAKDFARRGATVILGCRDEKRGTAARDLIIKETGQKNVMYKHLDLCSFKAIHDFAADILRSETRLDILVNNAGTGKLDNSLTLDNLPIEMQINYFGPCLLTKLLLPILKSSAPSRIINVSSVMHKFGKIDLNNIHLPAKNAFNHSRVYSNSKLANILFTKELSQRLAGTNVTVNCLHPGGVNTNIFRHQPMVVRFLLGLLLKTSWEGAQTTIYLAISPEVDGVSGKYFSDCNQVTPSKTAQDSVLAGELWDLTEKLIST